MTFSKLSVLVPTRKRVTRLQTMLESYALTTKDDRESSEIVFRVDEDDEETQEFLEDHRQLSVNHLSYIVGPRLCGYDSMPVFFNEMSIHAIGDVLMCGNDDMVFKTLNWPQAILGAANLFPDGLFDIGVTTHNETHYPFSVVSRRVAERLGFLWDPRIFWGDIFLRDVMAWFGRTVMVPEVEIEHDWAGNNPDQVFLEADKDIVRRSPAYWSETHAVAVAEAIGKLKELHA